MAFLCVLFRMRYLVPVAAPRPTRPSLPLQAALSPSTLMTLRPCAGARPIGSRSRRRFAAQSFLRSGRWVLRARAYGCRPVLSVVSTRDAVPVRTCVYVCVYVFVYV